MNPNLTFTDLGISKNFAKGLKELNIIHPTQIQEEVIPFLLETKTDLVGQAQTGTGKTAAYGLPLLHQIDSNKNKVQGLILCPTRELSQQVAKQLFRFTKYTSKIFTEAVYGGARIDEQIRKLQRPTHVIVATPGRLIDLVNKNVVDLSHVQTVILDEADEMLSMGFKDELEQILDFVADADQKWLFSATMPHQIQHIVNKHLDEDAHKISVSKDVVNKKIEHQYVICEESEKFFELQEFLSEQGKNRGLIFCKTRAATQKLAKQLISKHIAADAIHGDLLQKERDKVLRAFKNQKLRVLVATDIAARGLDVEGLSFVAHYQLPDKSEYYTHRSGRTARAGRSGISRCIVSSAEMRQLRYFEKSLEIVFNQIV